LISLITINSVVPVLKGSNIKIVFNNVNSMLNHLEIMHIDLCGPMETSSLGEARYFLYFTCDYSKLRMIYFLKEKRETVGKINEMLQTMKTQICENSSM